VYGGTQADRKTRRRSAIGIDRTGETLFFGLGEEVGPKHLAAGMRAAGAWAAAQLDINWNWTRFLLVGDKEGGSSAEITSTLVPKMNHGRREYVVRPSQRDFFFLARRTVVAGVPASDARRQGEHAPEAAP
jgi:hypothetical protein